MTLTAGDKGYILAVLCGNGYIEGKDFSLGTERFDGLGYLLEERRGRLCCIAEGRCPKKDSQNAQDGGCHSLSLVS